MKHGEEMIYFRDYRENSKGLYTNQDGETVSGFIYYTDKPSEFFEENLYIYDIGENPVDGCRYFLQLERDEFYSNNIAELETRLFDWHKVANYPEYSFKIEVIK